MGKIVKIILILLAPLGPLGPISYSFAKTWFPHKKANAAYHTGDFATAREILEKEQVEKPNDPLINYNLGTIYYKQKEYQFAKESFQRAATHAFSNNKSLLEKSYFNLGNSFYKNTLEMLPEGWEKDDKNLPEETKNKAIAEVQEAIEKYKNALNLNKDNKRTQTNKKKAEELLSKLQKKQNKNNQNKQDKKDKKDKDKQNKDKKDKQDKQDNKKQNDKQKPNKQKQKKEKQPQNLQERRAEAVLKKLQEDEKKLQKQLFAQKVKNTKQAKNKYQKPW